MSIMELGALGEFVAALAVLVTLVYLTIQIRHTRKESGRAVLQSRAEMAIGTQMSSAASDGLSAAYARAAEAIGEVPVGFTAELMKRGVSREDAMRLRRAQIATWRRNATIFLVEGPGANDVMLQRQYSSGLNRLFWDHFDSGTSDNQFVAYVNQLLADSDMEAQQ